MTLLFQQQLLKGEKPLDSKCLWWGFDDGVFVLTDNHFHHWRITPCQRGLWPKEFPYELNKSSAKGDLSKTFAQLLGLRMPQLYSDIRFLAKMATFGTNNFPAPATIFKLNSLIVDPVFIHTSLRSSNSGEIVADPYVFLR